MRQSEYAPLFLVGLVFAGFLYAGNAHAETSLVTSPAEAPVPMVIKSKSLEVDDGQKLVTFTGDVNATRGEFVIDCQKMILYYDKLPAAGQAGKSDTKIKEIVATGEVRVTRAQGGVATAEKAVYYQNDEKVVLTGKPSVKQGKDSIEGDRITLFLKENRSVVESFEHKKVTATIFPKAKER
jgi:lipopolysaccharide export system protein LptA